MPRTLKCISWLAIWPLLAGFPLEFCGQVFPPPRFSEPSGWQEHPLTLALFPDDLPGAVIRYTLDGSRPTGTSPGYTGPILLTRTTVVRASWWVEGREVSPPLARTFLFVEDILGQPSLPAGFPATWRGFPASYGMDPAVAQDPELGKFVRENLRALPLLCLTLPVDDLFGWQQGIYSNSTERGRDWEREAAVEWIEDGDGPGFSVMAGLRVAGGFSRRHDLNPKHALRIYFRSDYGMSRLRYDLFGEGAASSFNVLLARAGYNNTWVSRRIEQREKALYLRDAWTSATHREMGWPAPRERFAHTFLNGLYWGIYQLQEQLDADFFAHYLGGSAGDWDVVKHADLDPWPAFPSFEVKDGEAAAWLEAYRLARNADLRQPQAYEALAQWVDYSSLADYMLLNSWGGNVDGPVIVNGIHGNNWYAARPRRPDGRFTFAVWDSEWMLLDLAANTLGVEGEYNPAVLFQNLRLNPEFRLLFADRAFLHLRPGGALSPERNRQRLDALAKPWSEALWAESARWGNHRTAPGPSLRPDQDWLPNLEWVRQVFIPQRNALYLEQLRAEGLYPALDPPEARFEPPPSSPRLFLSHPDHGATLFFTVDGSDPRRAEGRVGLSAQVFLAPLAVPAASEVRARARQEGVWSPLLVATAPSSGSLPSPWQGLHPDPEGRVDSPWFGVFFFQSQSFPFLLHRDHGWIYQSGAEADSLWFWEPRMGWFWTSRSVYPNLWPAEGSQWLFFLSEGAWFPADRLFFSYEQGTWVRESDWLETLFGPEPSGLSPATSGR